MHELDEQGSRRAALKVCQSSLAEMRAEERVAWALQNLPAQHVVSSSFGAQSAVMLHLLTQQQADIPVIIVDTGYLFAETYRFIAVLRDKLQLNLHVYRPVRSPAWQEAQDGERWEQGIAGIEKYNRENKIEPMERALAILAVGTWFAGLRRSQSRGRSDTSFIESSGERWKVHPIADWSDRDVHKYLRLHHLPYHPMWEKGYVSIGDVHTTRSLHDASSAEQTRFFGLKRECGLHEMDFGKTG
ncbi:MAG: phosphoadenylyl-sulfate reductase [Gammaproteobacteria bacterium]|nr:phosphoadenylyl-sulfate reductase [Gammaproteobacteria bacterium]